MAIYSLNEAYKSQEFFYMCNACGDINKPGAAPDDFQVYQPEDVMTPQEQDLYTNCWCEGRGCLEYVLRIGDKAAMGLAFLCDEIWCQELVERMTHTTVTDSDVRLIWMPRLFLAIKSVAETCIQPLVPECDIYIGDQTDPDGHEIVVAVPYHLRGRLADIVKKLDNTVYEAIEVSFGRR